MPTKVSLALLLINSLTAAPVAKPKSPPRVVPLSRSTTTCAQGYADTQLALRPDIRDFENSGKAAYTRLIKTEATYETLYYGPDGSVQKRRHKATAFGSGVAYMRRNEEVYYLTNYHVAVLPPVTNEQSKVEGVPAGAKKVAEESRLVESDSDENYAKQLKLTKVVLDQQADAAIVKARPTVEQPLMVMPYKIGKSSELRAGDYVWVRGFPLGVFQAVNVGRVTNPLDEDTEQGWSHRDFIIDALLSSGNSGSPVFAIECKTQTLELVGLFHAAFRSGSALNAVVAIDELREMMETLRAPKRAPRAVDASPLSLGDRHALRQVIEGELPSRAFPFGGFAASVAAVDGSYRFSVYEKDYPATIDPRIWLVDKPGAEDEFGVLVEVGFRDRSGMEHMLSVEKLDAGLRGALMDLYGALARQFSLVESTRSRSASQPVDVGRELSRQKNVQRDHLEIALDALAEEWTERQSQY